MNWLSKALVLGTTPSISARGAFGHCEGEDRVITLTETSPKPYFSFAVPDYVVLWTRTHYRDALPQDNVIASQLTQAINMEAKYNIIETKMEGEVYTAITDKQWSMENECNYYLVDFRELDARYRCDMTLFKSEPIPATILQAKVQALSKYHIPSGYIRYRDFRTEYLLVKAQETLQVTKVTGEEIKIDLEPKSVEIYDEGELPVSSTEIKALITAIS
ncbi:MAG: hypothetical protein ABSB40_00825 [Nitrososphaeria archaeon]|jgi:hypothetical protein